MTTKEKLQRIAKKYRDVSYNENNYEVGGGLSGERFESNRHSDARNDSGKVTLGRANEMFAKATGLSTAQVKEIIMNHFSDIEWHHAGALPKSYGGGMKKTYFVNSEQIVELAENFEETRLEIESKTQAKQDLEQTKKSLNDRRLEYLYYHAYKVSRVPSLEFKERYYVTIIREMNGKYGWFEANFKYNIPSYITAWVFSSEEEYNEYYNIK